MRFTVGQIPADPQVFHMVDDDGNARDLTAYSSLKAVMIKGDGGLVDPVGIIDPINPSLPDTVVLHWGTVTSPFPVAGTYQLQLQFKGPGNIDDYSATTTFIVDPVVGQLSIPTWCTAAEAGLITNKVMTEDNVVASQQIVETVTNRTPAASANIGKRDLIWLKRAVAYQAAWMLTQPDLFGRSAVQGVDQDGMRAMFSSKAAVYLAPLAIRAIKNLTWIKTKSLRVKTPFIDASLDGATNPLIDDSLWVWSPMPGMGGTADYSYPSWWPQTGWVS